MSRENLGGYLSYDSHLYFILCHGQVLSICFKLSTIAQGASHLCSRRKRAKFQMTLPRRKDMYLYVVLAVVGK